MMDFSEMVTLRIDAIMRERAAQIEDALQAAWLAHLPVDHVRYHDDMPGSGVIARWDLVLPGGYVFASGGIRVRQAAI